MRGNVLRGQLWAAIPAICLWVMPYGGHAQTLGSGFGSGLAKLPAPHPAYTAEFKITSVHTLANGTTITHITRESVMRDSAGRTRSETITEMPSGGLHLVTLHDPATHMTTTWNSNQKKAVMMTRPDPGVQGCPASGAKIAVRNDIIVGEVMPGNTSTAQKTQAIREDLGTKTIFGVQANGARFTRTVPAGAQGNDAPLTTTYETWMAPGFGLLESRRESAEIGTTTREVTNLQMGEPDAALFEIPADYEVVHHEVASSLCADTTRITAQGQTEAPSPQ